MSERARRTSIWDPGIVRQASLDALRKLDPRTRLRIAMRKDGTLNGIIVRRMAADGRSITSSILRFDNDGRVVVHETRWFDKR